MFCFFKNDEFVNFWSNQVGDIFCLLTIKGMKWQEGDIDLVFYPLLEDIPHYYEFGSNKELIIKNRYADFVKEEVLDDNGNVKTDESGMKIFTTREVESFTIDRTISPEVFFAKGLMIRPC